MVKRGRNVEKESYWRDVLARQVSSGLSVRAFCRSQSIREASFYFWRRTLEERDREKAPTGTNHVQPRRNMRLMRNGTPRFVPAVIESLRETSAVLELASGHTLRLPPSIPVPDLIQLVLALESRGDR